MDYKDWVVREKYTVRPPGWVFDAALYEDDDMKEKEGEVVEFRTGDGALIRKHFETSDLYYPAPTPTSFDRDDCTVFPGMGTLRKFMYETRGTFMIPCGGRSPYGGSTDVCRETGTFFVFSTVIYKSGAPAFFQLAHGESSRIWNTNEPTLKQVLFAVQDICDESEGCVPFWMC